MGALSTASKSHFFHLLFRRQIDQELDDEDGAEEEDDPAEALAAARRQPGLTKKEKLKLKQEAEDLGMLDVMFALAAIQLRFGRRDVAMLFAVDQVLAALAAA